MPYKDPEVRRAYRKKWYATHRKEQIKRCMEYSRKNPHIVAKIQRKFNYNITKEEYEKLLDLQNNSCIICSRSFSEVKPVVDHDHSTNIIRGILCNDCNLGLGRFKDSIQIMLKAIQYLGEGNGN
jgi:hypothetical protein